MAEILIRPTKDIASAVAASVVADTVRAKSDAVLGVATGSTPENLYQALASHLSDGVDFSRITAFGLDEYVGLPLGHPESYREVLLRALVPLGVASGKVNVPDPSPERLETAGERYESAIDAAGGVDLQILGIGTDGHIGFNEPGSSLGSATRLKTLSAQTRRDNSQFFASEEDVPRLCLTQGIGTILRARSLLLLAFGEGKAEAVRAAVEGPLTASCPGSAIQLHPRVIVLLDDAAASCLALADYYRETEAAKPAWQRHV